jgi:hypothetical protein
MMFIDLTNELAPILMGLNAALLISAAGIVANIVPSTWFASLRHAARPGLALHRPALAR